MGYQEEFEKQVWWVAENVSFDKDLVVSLFETNIRLLGKPTTDLSPSPEP